MMRYERAKRGMGGRNYAGKRSRFRRNPAINYRDFKGELYNRARGREIKRKWKNPKAGLRRKRYYLNR